MAFPRIETPIGVTTVLLISTRLPAALAIVMALKEIPTLRR
jgi:hypothetical protein